MSKHTIVIAEQFTKYPGPRYRRDGRFSGEEFRDNWLIPALREADAAGDVVEVVLDGVAGYGSSFLEEAFGGLVRAGFSVPKIDALLRIVAETSRFQHHRQRALSYIKEEASRLQVA